MNKGGKFIFGESVIRQDGLVQLPPQAVDEYHIASEGKVYLFTGSKSTGFYLFAAVTSPLPWGQKDHCWKKRLISMAKFRYFSRKE